MSFPQSGQSPWVSPSRDVGDPLLPLRQCQGWYLNLCCSLRCKISCKNVPQITKSNSAPCTLRDNSSQAATHPKTASNRDLETYLLTPQMQGEGMDRVISHYSRLASLRPWDQGRKKVVHFLPSLPGCLFWNIHSCFRFWAGSSPSSLKRVFVVISGKIVWLKIIGIIME